MKMKTAIETQSKLAVAVANQELKYKNREMKRAFEELEAGLDLVMAVHRTNIHGSSVVSEKQNLIGSVQVIQEEMEKAKELSLAVSHCSI